MRHLMLVALGTGAGVAYRPLAGRRTSASVPSGNAPSGRMPAGLAGTAVTSPACRANTASSPWDGNTGEVLTGAAVNAAAGRDLSGLRGGSSGAKVGGGGGYCDASQCDGLKHGRHGGLRCRGRAGCLGSGSSPVECQKNYSLSTGQCARLYRPSIRYL